MSALGQKATETNSSTNINEGGKGGVFSNEKPEIIIPERIPSENPRDFKSIEEIDHYLRSFNIKGNRK